MLHIEHPPFLTDLLTLDERAAVISHFYDRVFADPQLSPLFAGIAQPLQEQRLAGFLQMSRGRSGPTNGAALRGVHARLPITPALLRHRWSLMVAAIEEAGHGAEVMDCWRRYDAAWWRYILGR